MTRSERSGAVSLDHASQQLTPWGWLALVTAGFMYPIIQCGMRTAVQRLLRAKVSRSSLDFAGVLVLLLEVFTSSPQFYVLTMCVAACC